MDWIRVVFRAWCVSSARCSVPDRRMWDTAGLSAPYSLRGRLGSFAGTPEALAGGVVTLSDNDYAVGAASDGLLVDGAGLPASVEGVGEISLAQTGVEAHVSVDSVLVHVTAIVLVETLWK